jgi:hypothetical protein
MSSIGTVYGPLENVAPVKANAKSWFVGTGAQIAALPVSEEHNFAKCIATGSGFNLNVCYFRNALQSTWFPFFHKHKHAVDTEEDGGLLYEAMVENTKFTYQVNLHSPRSDSFAYEGTDVIATGIENRIGASFMFVRLNTTTAVDSYSNAQIGGLNLSWAFPIAYFIKLSATHNADVLWRSGIGMEGANEAANVTTKMGIEICSGDGTSIQVVTSNGVTRTKTTTGVVGPVSDLTRNGLAQILTPGTSVITKHHAGTTTSKTSNIPSTGIVQEDDVCQTSIRTTNVTLKRMGIFAMSIFGRIGDPAWVNF